MSLINVDLSGLSKPGVKLIEKIGSAIGVIYEPTRIRRNARANADADKTKLISKLQLEGIERRAAERLLNREVQRQKNIEKITYQAAQELKEGDNVEHIDKDWLNTFLDECEDVSNEDLQLIWSRILLGEAKSNGSFSKRTLKFISSLDKEEADLIYSFGKYIWVINFEAILTCTLGNLEKTYNLDFDTINKLDSLGIIRQGLGYSLNFNAKNVIMTYHNINVLVQFDSESIEDWKVDIGTVLLTPMGKQILKLCDITPDFDYFKIAVDEINKLDKVTAVITQ